MGKFRESEERVWKATGGVIEWAERWHVLRRRANAVLLFFFQWRSMKAPIATLFLALVLSAGSFICPMSADTVVQIGDSVADSATNRAYTNIWFSDRQLELPTWIGDHGGGRPTFARGGMTFNSMLAGRDTSSGREPGLQEIVDDYSVPDYLYVLGGYNNVAYEADDSDMLGSRDSLRAILGLASTAWPETKVFVANVTMFSETGSYASKRSNVLTLNQLIAEEVAARDNVYLVDNYSVIGASELNSDGLHLNNLGQIKIGENFARTLHLVSVPEPSSGLSFGLVFSLVLLRRNRLR